MNSDPRLRAALQSSVHWYDVMCGAHGSPGEHRPTFWIHRGVVPPYHSNFITLEGELHARTQLAAIQSLIDTDEQRGAGVKDSFQCLELEPLGFRVLFQATWIYRPAHLPDPPSEPDDLAWYAVQDPADLATWERTWRGMDANAEAREHPPIFLPSLLENPDFRFLLGRRGQTPVATAALNRTPHAVGLSNVFSASEDERLLFCGGVRAARSVYPDLPLVGYEHGPSLNAATAIGFEAVHGLIVWVREGHASAGADR